MTKKKPKIPAKGLNVRFQTAPPPRQTFDFAPDQKWVGARRKRQLTYIDVTPDVAARSSLPESSANEPPTTRPTKKRPSTAHNPPPIIVWRAHKPRTPVSLPEPEPEDESETLPIEYRESSPGLSSRTQYPPGPLCGLPESNNDSSYLDIEEACLTRHFVEHLAPLFDTSDRDRHFAIVVPERAVLCPVLRYAVYTASAGHLIRLAQCRNGSPDNISFDGMPLPSLNPEAAIRYHDICSSHLIEISKDPKEEYNEDVLTAATILRFYEQIDAPTVGHSETYRNAIQFIVNTQKDESFYAYQTIDGPARDSSLHLTPSPSLRHSACLAALRQEIWSAFLNQRPFRLPVSRFNDYTLCDPNNDFIRANRIFIWVADLLIFCFGEDQFPTAHDRMQRWSMLKAVLQRWEEQKPAPLKPIYFQERDPNSGRFFPVIWYTNACQVAGAQHVELGRILLAVSHPNSTSRLGIGANSRNQALSAELQDSTRRLCGLALSNPKSQSAMITAMIGISVCGEYFTDPTEQEALLHLLRYLEYDYAWPTQSTIAALQASWAASINET
ncbi:hypothetical protein BJX62DRAFT_54731 [Aspergillus germanicus]